MYLFRFRLQSMMKTMMFLQWYSSIVHYGACLFYHDLRCSFKGLVTVPLKVYTKDLWSPVQKFTTSKAWGIRAVPFLPLHHQYHYIMQFGRMMSFMIAKKYLYIYIYIIMDIWWIFLPDIFWVPGYRIGYQSITSLSDQNRWSEWWKSASPNRAVKLRGS